MASLLSAGAASDTRVADLDRLTERGLDAAVDGRCALAATLFLRSENLAIQLHDDDTAEEGGEGDTLYFISPAYTHKPTLTVQTLSREDTESLYYHNTSS